MPTEKLRALTGVGQVTRGNIGDLRYEMKPCAGYLMIKYWGAPATFDEADEWAAAVDQMLSSNELDRAIWDSREADQHPPEVRDHAWEWLKRAEVIKASAVLVQSSLLRTSANMGAMSREVTIRSFHDVYEAEKWILSAV